MGLEFEIPEDSLLVASGRVTVILPGYMTSLTQHEISELQVAPQRANMIIACGIDPKSKDIVMLTGGGQFLELSTKSFRDKLEIMHCVPDDNGHTIIFPGPEKTYELAADWAIENAHSLNVSVDLGIKNV